ncbi:LuxR C-terminal-related transcriptional regulator [Streptomyces sp. KL116D]|uniref:LuxR C-terminal-related transcriptional regulator n=1 Tax=Streptomyces sp. KL116D TaxID=3045152 RepID=UPI0035574B10
MTQLSYGAWLRRRRRVVESRTARHRRDPLPCTGRHVPRGTRGIGAAGGRRHGHRTGAGHRGPPALPPAADHRPPRRPGTDEPGHREQLHLSARTVASHLYQIFPKLDVTSRAQLATRKDLR